MFVLSTLSIVHQKRVGLGWGSLGYGLGSACLRIVPGAILGLLQRLHFLGSIDEGYAATTKQTTICVVHSEIHPAMKEIP
jgi:hypothetical protein